MRSQKLLGGLNGTFRELTEVGGFQDVSPADRSVSVIRHDIAGLTLYGSTGNGKRDELWPRNHTYAMIFESEDGGEQPIVQLILESDDPRTIWRLLELIDQHANRVKRKISLLTAIRDVGAGRDPDCATRSPLNLEAVGAFDDLDTRTAVENTLAGLTETSMDDAYGGFVNAVCSTVDAWLTARSL